MSILNHNSFSPECLTISLGSNCNLNCLYCYSEKNQADEKDHLNENEFLACVLKAAEIVALNCKAKNIPFFLGFQGSGEPLMYFKMLKNIFKLISAMAQQNNLKLFSFITSNGCMEAHKYKWVAKNFSRICISLDGSKEINDLQRSAKDNNSTYNRILATINILRQNQKIPVIRTTVTKYNVDSLVPIVSHFINDLELSKIQAEPVYLVGQKGTLPPSPDAFVENFIKAKRLAIKTGATLTYSGYRKNEKHGVYCNINKNVLFIGPNGKASICLFKDKEKKESPYVIGYYDGKDNQFVIDHVRILRLKEAIDRIYQDCENCEIQNSCVKGCPDRCIFEHGSNDAIHESLRCKINRLLYQKQM
jgi:radical SAM protein with 4Fe4S-binding SPASM domain